MVDQEVVEILTEIKRQVSTAGEKSISESSTRANVPAPAGRSGFASLPVLARTWDRLPPLLSKRTGTPARLELWIKGKLKRAFRWFTWEQVNFNAAAYQTFLELVETLNSWEQQSQKLEAEREDLKNQLAALSSITRQLEQQLAIVAQLNARVEGLSQMAKDQKSETQARLAQLVAETRLGDENLLDEQRVCHKQLALELSEFRVLQDRALRELEKRVAKLETETG